jgi:hypothetical protein
MSQRKQSATITKTTQSILCAERTIVNCSSPLEHVNASCAYRVGVLVLNLVVHIVTARI